MASTRPELPAIPRGCGWTLILFALFSLIIGILSVAAIPLVWQRSEEVWVEVPAKISETFVERGERRGNTVSGNGSSKKSKSTSTAVTFVVMLRYDYTVSGKSFSGTSRCLEQPEDDEKYALAAAIVEKYPVGKVIPAFHHPKDFERSRLTAKEARREVTFDFIFAGLFSLFGIVGVYFGIVILRRHGR